MSAAKVSDRVLTDSLEDYLEAIYHIIQKKQVARAKDISARLRVRSSSVTGALHGLASRELVNYQPYDYVTLTDKGQCLAERIVRRHTVIHDFLVRVLGVEEDDADNAACRMEHAVRGEILERLVHFLEFLDRCPRGNGPWLEGFSKYCEKGISLDRCQACLQECLHRVARERMEKE